MLPLVFPLDVTFSSPNIKFAADLQDFHRLIAVKTQHNFTILPTWNPTQSINSINSLNVNVKG